MKFNEKLKKVMQELHINQSQLVGLTGIGKSSISQYLSGRNVPAEERQRDIAVSLGLDADYFTNIMPVISKPTNDGRIPKADVNAVAKLLGMNHHTVRQGLQQGVFPWGYAIHTSENRWVYFINEKRFREIEGV
ncbi:MAG: helix-turn-helix transcriptional regulator [Lachnospiraceae bacterium]